MTARISSPLPLVLVDGSGYIFRAYHALPPLTRPDGVPVGAVFGFVSMLLKVLEQQHNHQVVVIFDAGRVTFRQDIYPDYKSHRPPPPDDLIPQFPLTREACEAMGILSVELPGFEADDVIATYARLAREAGHAVKIISADKDLMQLMGPSVTLFDPMKNRDITRDHVREKFGVFPEQVLDVQALMGDRSDHIPGVPGIGPKGAAQLIEQFGTLENVLMHINDVQKPGHRKALETHQHLARISKTLCLLRDDAPVPYGLDVLMTHQALPPGENIQVLETFLTRQGFTSLVGRARRVFGERGTLPVQQEVISASTPRPAVSYTLMRSVEMLRAWIDAGRDAPVWAIDTETTSLSPHVATCVGISLCYQGGNACYIPLQHRPMQGLLGERQETPYVFDAECVISILQPLLESPHLTKVFHHMKYDVQILKKMGLSVQGPFDDTVLMSYVLDGTQTFHGLDVLALKYLERTMTPIQSLIGSGKNQRTFDTVPLDQACDYAAADADVTWQLYHCLKDRLRTEQKEEIYERFEKPLIAILADMERTGILVDAAHLMQLSRSFDAQLQTLSEEIYQHAGCRFNIASPKQLGEILFQQLGMTSGKKGKSGELSTGAQVLETLAEQGHTLPRLVLSWRGLSKLKNTYTDALCQEQDPQTGRVYTTYNQTATLTGRLSSSHPNLQNIPIRTEEGRAIRLAFVAPKNHVLLSLDYSQIELRLLAHMADVPALSAAFLAGGDIHASTASHVFGVSLDEVTESQRRQAKAINFGIIYGISPFGLSQQIGVPQSEAKRFIELYFQTYPGIQAYMETMKTLARQNGSVSTLFGRLCAIPDIHDKNPVKRAFGERQAINAPLQGSAADLMKLAMIAVAEDLRAKNAPVSLLLQVHDELVFECPLSWVERMASPIQTIMEDVVPLRVPLRVDVKVGTNWGTMQSLAAFTKTAASA